MKDTLPSDWKHFAFVVAGIGVMCLSVVPAFASIKAELLAAGAGLFGWGGLKRPGDITPEVKP